MEKCKKPDCPAPKGLCSEHINEEYRKCQYWIVDNTEEPASTVKVERKVNKIPWSGLALLPQEIGLLSHRSSPKIIGTVGAANAGKTSYLGMLYTLLFNGKRLQHGDFAGSYSLIGWETLAQYLQVKSNGKVDFPAPTPSNRDYYALYHLALRKERHFHDVLFADSSGEVFSQWATDTSDPNAENARWIYKNADAFIFFVDTEDIIKRRGSAKAQITQLAGQMSTNLLGRPVAVVWSKSDKIGKIRENIKRAIEEAIMRSFPSSRSFQISNFSRSGSDELCHQNNLAVVDYLLEQLDTVKPLRLAPSIIGTSDFFFKYRGSYDSK